MVIVKLLRHIQCEMGLFKPIHAYHELFIDRSDCLTIRVTVLINYLNIYDAMNIIHPTTTTYTYTGDK